MIHDVISSAAMIWPRIALILFFALFAGIVVWTVRGGRERFSRESRLPLDDEPTISGNSTDPISDAPRTQP